MYLKFHVNVFGVGQEFYVVVLLSVSLHVEVMRMWNRVCILREYLNKYDIVHDSGQL